MNRLLWRWLTLRSCPLQATVLLILPMTTAETLGSTGLLQIATSHGLCGTMFGGVAGGGAYSSMFSSSATFI